MLNFDSSSRCILRFKIDLKDGYLFKMRCLNYMLNFYDERKICYHRYQQKILKNVFNKINV